MKDPLYYVESVLRKANFDDVFIVDDINRCKYTYNDFFSLCIAKCNELKEKLKNRHVVAVMENSFELALLYFCVMFTNDCIIVIDPQKGESEIKAILNEIPDRYVMRDGDFYDSKNSRIIIQTDDNCRSRAINGISERNYYDDYLITFTSGTSGRTKGVVHSLGNLILSAVSLDKSVLSPKDACFLHVMPMTYMAGILNSLIYPFIIGAKIVITKRFSIMTARSFWETSIKYGANLFWLSPSMLTMIDQMDRDHSGEEYCKNDLVFLVGTAALSNNLRKSILDRYRLRLYASYGLTETLFVSIETDETLQISEKNCVGELLDGVSYSLDESGELSISVPWMYKRYTNESGEGYMHNGFYRTGDLARIESDCLYIMGREKDLIIKGGLNISPILIENAVRENDNVRDVSVVGVENEYGDESVCCAIVVNDYKADKDDIKVIESDITNNVVRKLGKHYSIDCFIELSELPRNINGKIDKKEIVSIWEKENK